MRKLPLTKRLEKMKVNQIISVTVWDKGLQTHIYKTGKRLNFIFWTKNVNGVLKIWRAG